ncbi:unnamed protein product [Spirodela intermedia]|uniref:Uncharacterized protein n=1 Tax=Spirodela intermedia TaxID=51605 RepID=A0A7I8J3A7_SPIIN|nr:unnamed protein product [Spirodela intermedia]CAA6664599.1 unnamed protein product [Spirodela intermedia]
MRTPSSGGSSFQRSPSDRMFMDFLAMDHHGSDDSSRSLGAAMPPEFLRGDLVEVMLELDAESAFVRSVTPASVALLSAAGEGTSGNLSQCSSTESKIRRKFPWLRSPSPRRSRSSSPWLRDLQDPAVIAARDARRNQARLDRTRSGAQQALKGLRFIRSQTATTGGAGDADALWRAVEERFHALSKDGLLSRDDFGECIGMVDSEEFAKGIFDALARRRRQNLERITKEELRDFWLQISDQSFDARLQIFFDMVDTNVDGRITREEVQELIILSASANKLSKLKEQAEEYAALIMEELDPEDSATSRDYYMNYSRPLSAASMGWSQSLHGGAASMGWWHVRPIALVRWLGHRIRWSTQEHWQRALFSWKFVQYRRRPEFHVMGYCLPSAKGAAETLKLNMALVLLPVCRNTLTWLRSTRARLFVPFDDNINFHKVHDRGAIVGGILLHAGNHLACDFPRKKPTYGSFVGSVEGVTGILMVILMALSFTLATSWFRKSALRLPAPLNRLTGFNAFWYSHHLLAVVYLLLVVHGFFMHLVHHWYQKTTWMYITVPLLLYLGERSLRTLRSEASTVKILKVSVLPGNVLTVVMSKPLGFRYKSGQYIFLKCPAISPFEWHPFSITSAPGDGHLSVHIRTLGDWTQELRQVFTEANSAAVIGRGTFSEVGTVPQKRVPRLLVDGPYGAPAQNYKNYDVLLLVGLGIGATPFISILRDLLNNIRATEEQLDSSSYTDTSRSDDGVNSIGYTWSGGSGGGSKKRAQKTTSAHFYWVTREPGSFEWFKGVMNEVAEMDQKGVIEMHNYLTSVYEEGDARSTLLTMVQALNHAKHGVDIVSGTRVRTHFARPNWSDVFARIASKHAGATVGVFYCGTPALAKELKSLSHELTHRTSTRFDFHKEYF